MKGRRVRNIVTRCNEITGLPQGQSDSSISHVHGQPSLVIVRDRILAHFCQAVISHDFFFFGLLPINYKKPNILQMKNICLGSSRTTHERRWGFLLAFTESTGSNLAFGVRMTGVHNIEEIADQVIGGVT